LSQAQHYRERMEEVTKEIEDLNAKVAKMAKLQPNRESIRGIRIQR
jgi:hypothetical protein